MSIDFDKEYDYVCKEIFKLRELDSKWFTVNELMLLMQPIEYSISSVKESMVIISALKNKYQRRFEQ